ncbi:MAG: diacylglycerol kinase family protein [Bacteroidetes bacterium]|nr:diacylglycerol kinase family protein [Bacteroidota bacterium]
MKLLRSFGYAMKGFIVAVREELNLKIHLMAAMVVVGLGFYYRISSGEWLALLAMIGLVISLELINTAVENLTDLVTKSQHPLAGKVKDISAAAVLVASVASVIVGIIIFAKYIF